MNRSEAQRRMREVQRIMERTTLYTLLPGPPAVVGGVLALAGCAVSFALIRSLDFQAFLGLSLGGQVAFCTMWLVIGVLSVGFEVMWGASAARRRGIDPGNRPARLAAWSLSPSVVVAVVLTARFLQDSQVGYIVPAWMMCYGTGVYAAGLFSVRLPRLLGLSFIVLGAVGLLLFREYGLVLAALSFGGLHLLFGALVMRRSRMSGET